MIAFKGGGALDTVIPGKTGLYFEEQSVESLKRALLAFDESDYKPADMRAHAMKFDSALFKRQIMDYVDRAWTSAPLV